jgi:putative ABC transport system substrate-binding protein
MHFDRVKRREFITLLGGAAAWPLAARAQHGERMRRIGVLLPATEDDTEYHSWMRTFLRVLGQSGWTIGLNLQVVPTGLGPMWISFAVKPWN